MRCIANGELFSRLTCVWHASTVQRCPNHALHHNKTRSVNADVLTWIADMKNCWAWMDPSCPPAAEADKPGGSKESSQLVSCSPVWKSLQRSSTHRTLRHYRNHLHHSGGVYVSMNNSVVCHQCVNYVIGSTCTTFDECHSTCEFCVQRVRSYAFGRVWKGEIKIKDDCLSVSYMTVCFLYYFFAYCEVRCVAVHDMVYCM